MKTKLLKYLNISILFLIITTSYSACVSIDERFLINTLDDEEKSKIITDKGVILYNTYLIENEEYQKLNEFRQYFEVALVFNPDNKTASLYLEKINSYITVKVAEKLKTAKNYQAKKSRSEADTFNMCYAISLAYSLNPADPEVNKLRSETALIRENMIKGYLEKGKSILNEIKKEDNDDTKEKKYLQALDYYTKVLKLTPENNPGKLEKQAITAEIAIIFEKKYTLAETKLTEKKFSETEAQLKALQEINKKIDNLYDDEIVKISYQLYFQWAKLYFSQANYTLADSKARIALSVTRTQEALALRDKISAIISKKNTALAFEEDLKNIDALIAQKNILVATNEIQALQAKTTESQKIQQLKQRQDKIREQLTGHYQQGVKFYQEENYKKAIEVLETVVMIDAGYEQASIYLEKARTKQKILE